MGYQGVQWCFRRFQGVRRGVPRVFGDVPAGFRGVPEVFMGFQGCT